MSFCDNIMQQSKSNGGDEASSGYKPEYQRQFDQHRQDDENQYNLPQHNVEPNLDRSYPLHNYIVVILGYGSEEPPTQVLNRSSGFCRMPVSWEYGGVPGRVVCYITIDNHVRIKLSFILNLIARFQVVCEESAVGKSEARDKAAAKAIDILRRHCYTIQVSSSNLRLVFIRTKALHCHVLMFIC